MRLSFVCGNRALAQTQQDFQSLSRSAKALGTSLGNVDTQIAALQTRLANSEKHRQQLEKESATRAGIDLYTQTVPDADGMRRLLITVSAIEKAHRQQATAFAAQPKAILLMHSASGLMLACSRDSGINAGEVLKRVLARFGARGDGSPTLAQGSLPDGAVVQELRRELAPLQSFPKTTCAK
jgi:alanyl-tRNA synthetase